MEARNRRDNFLVPVQDGGRTLAWSRQLIRAHDVLRQQLQDVQEDLGSAEAGQALVIHCLAFCSALSAHHEGEDGGLFGELLLARPDLQDAVRKLTEDHQVIAGILASVRDLAREAAAAAPEHREAIRGELDGLAAIVESHFRYEERAIGGAIDDRVGDTGWTAAVFGLRT
jgi:hypothetical protein